MDRHRYKKVEAPPRKIWPAFINLAEDIKMLTQVRKMWQNRIKISTEVNKNLTKARSQILLLPESLVLRSRVGKILDLLRKSKPEIEKVCLSLQNLSQISKDLEEKETDFEKF